MAANLTELVPGRLSFVRGNEFVVNLDWQFPADLDLAALCISHDTRPPELVYHGNMGRRTSFPFAHLAHQSEGSDRVKQRREHLVITNAAAHSEIYFFVWDHMAVHLARAAEFAVNPESYRLCLSDRTNHKVRVATAPATACNCLLLARLRDGSAVHHCQSGILMEESDNPIDPLLALLEPQEQHHGT